MKKLKIASFIIGLLVLSLFLYSLFNYRILNREIEQGVSDYVDKYGYASVFILGFILESSPQPFVSALAPLASGLLVGLSFSTLLIITWVATTISSLTAYIIGRIYGKRFVTKLVDKESYEEYNNLFKKYGKLAFAIVALTPVPYFPVIAGVFKMKLKDFALYALSFRLAHYLIFSYLLFIIL